MACDVSIIIPVLNKLEFTRQCLDRIARNMRWTWNADAQRLFAAMDPALQREIAAEGA